MISNTELLVEHFVVFAKCSKNLNQRSLLNRRDFEAAPIEFHGDQFMKMFWKRLLGNMYNGGMLLPAAFIAHIVQESLILHVLLPQGLQLVSFLSHRPLSLGHDR